MKCSETHRAGFTLIEILVSAALTVLIMSLFAQIFALATGSIQDQRNIARFDQKSRVVTQTVLGDLEGRSYRQRNDAVDLGLGIIPMRPGDSIDVDRQRGYFYYSENDPRSRVDDVLQFTVDLERVRVSNQSNQSAPITFVGKSTLINRGGTAVSTANDLDQPEMDDGVNDGKTESRAAEVSYFVRGGNLYRRVLLLREASSEENDGQPTVNPNDASAPFVGPLMSAIGTVDSGPVARRLQTNYLPGDWYDDFDVAATRVQLDPEGDGNDTGGPNRDGDGDGVTADFSSIYVMHVNSLDNAGSKNPIALPWNRFGHLPIADRDLDNNLAPDFATSIERLNADGASLGFVDYGVFQPGQPYEFLRPTGAASASFPFIGRFTIGETSSPALGYPSVVLAPAAHPYHRVGMTLNGSGDLALVDQLETSSVPRQGEDIVLTNVVGFDVKVWDDGVGRFVDIGQASALAGVADGGVFTDSDPTTFGFQSPSRRNFAYGPNTPALNHVFDTWHPEINTEPPLAVSVSQVRNSNTIGAFERGVAGVNEIAAADRNTAGNRFEGTWDTRNTYQTGDVVVPDVSIAPYAAPTAPYGAPNGTFPGPITITQSIPTALADTAFVATIFDLNGGGPAASVQGSAIQPDWMKAITTGSVLQFPLTAGDDGILWTPVSDDGFGGVYRGDVANRVGLKKMQITVTVRDPKTNSLRDITLVHSFVE